jgi:hypothetical protein
VATNRAIHIFAHDREAEQDRICARGAQKIALRAIKSKRLP